MKDRYPLVHCITNPISIQQCANGLLAVGARPIMAEHPKEVREITETASALVLNLGNITDVRMTSMRICAGTAREKNIPILLDAVGAACSRLRRDFASELMDRALPNLIKGNYSEINALYRQDYRSSGVDAEGALDPAAVSQAAVELARKYQTVILASGKADIVTDGKRLVYVKNGTPQLSAVTGIGCMLGALCGAYLSEKNAFDAAVAGCAVLGICGQQARTEQGSGSFMLKLMDALSTLRDTDVEIYLDMEEISIETL